ncbi:replication endonuclease [Rhodoferax sp. TBRC 17198]|uniref:replication endonuclease n=1 Tax=Rhodoferax potami TaxID=3068338 RepID=UPI0028BDEAE5|nr:replication endonuclease [Rhodoferax sp. TBRC 17198]MDT7522025.1 replication endonuclease [Rhodoferax sp. TBRC 17198]
MFTRINTPHTGQELQGTLNGIALSMGAKPLPGKMTLHGAIARYTDPTWWRRNLRVQLLRENEGYEHAAGHVRRRQQCYVSNYAVKVKRVRAKASREVLERLEVVNEVGEAFNLAEVADGSVSNPALRRAELMVRCRGFEETAELMGHTALFLTITCPSRFHRFSKSGKTNPKWQGETPKDAQNYLCGIWKKIRAAWGNRGFFPYGFRVCEPHHDGCPHWHILLFFPADQAGWFVPQRFQAGRRDYGAGAVGIAGRYAMQDSPNEAGAAKHRFTVEVIEPERGSATGYIAKYICKNIDGMKEDGEAVGLDFASGTPAEEAAKRVRTWASTWGVRQFQPIGGPSVTVWREIRRLSNQIEEPLQTRLFEGAREAADSANWMAFWLIQGGPGARKKDLKLKPLYTEEEGGKYGDSIKRVTGIQGEGEELTTRLHTWTVQRQGLAAVDDIEADRKHMRELLRKAFGVNSAYEFERIGEAERTWTGVNNCTDSPEADESGADLAGFEAYMASMNRGDSPQPAPLRH